MPSKIGRLGVAAPNANESTVVYQAPADKAPVVSIAIVNRSNDNAVFSVAIAQTATPQAADWIEYETTLPAKGVFERTAQWLSPGERVVVLSNSAGLSVRVAGTEE